MDSENTPKDSVNIPAPPAPPPVVPVAPPVDTTPTSQPETEQRFANIETNIKKPMSSFERASIRWTIAMFTVTLFTGIFIAAQWLEIRKSSVDTRELAIAAKSQAANTESLAKSASSQVDELKNQIAELKRSADEAHSLVNFSEGNALKDRRPYVSVSIVDNPIYTVGSKAAWSFRFMNYGKSPAIRQIGRAQVVFGPNALTKMRKDLFEQLHTSANQTEGSIIAPGGDAYTTATSEETVTSGDIEFINATVGGIVVLAKFEYFDMAGNQYSTEICKARLATGAIADCSIHNKIK